MSQDGHHEKQHPETDHLERRTKIIATLGPASDDEDVLKQLVLAGVNLVRLNFSHGSHAEHQQRIETVQRVAAACNRVVGILADLQGPKIRVANFVDNKVVLEEGALFILDANLDDNAGTDQQVGIDYKQLPDDVSQDDILLLDDGRITLQVESVKQSAVQCRVIVGGELSNHKGINRKGGGLTAPALTEKDKADIDFLATQPIDYVAISFPRSAEDINTARALLEKTGTQAGIIAKIERAEAINCIDEIIGASDGVMVARGDLAVEIGDAEVPLQQKWIIERARSLNKPVIIATQMMESMIQSTVPTRAEVSDVSNAVLDNVDAVMLSAETAVGEHPLAVIEAVSRVCRVAERLPRTHISGHRVECQFQRTDEAIAMATMYTANHLDIRAIIALTESGATPLLMSRIRTAIPIYGLSRDRVTLGRMTLYRGVYPIPFDLMTYKRDEVNGEAVKTMQAWSVLDSGDLLILTKGDQMGVGGGSNAMKILEVGNVA